ncbi:MAG: sensor histidine kinase [Syntrophobacter sp.]
MDTFFAIAERASKSDIAAEIDIINTNHVMTGLLHSISGLLAVLNEHRQIVALNDSFLKLLGIEDPYESLGMRPGEALQCIYAQDGPSGCGTGRFCSTCGAAIAIVTSLGQNKPVERVCALTAKRAATTIDLALMVRSHPIDIDGRRFLLLFLQDITLQQQRAALERTFFHDICNMLNGLVGASELLSFDGCDSEFIKVIIQTSLRLKKEVEIQRCLLQTDQYSYQPLRQEVVPEQVMEELKSFYANHPAANRKSLHFSVSGRTMHVEADLSLLLRVLCNMITNALEATDENGLVKVWSEQNLTWLSFCVWNDKMISPDVARRIFQRNFSTKEDAGRGIGTYSMKLFGEKILGGKVTFSTSEEEGTVFKISLPL